MHKRVRQLVRVSTPRNLWIAGALSLSLAVVGGVLILPLFDHSDEELRSDLRDLIVNPPAVASRVAFVSAASNPLPNAGFPHGRGMTHGDFPTGYRFHGRPPGSFNNYVDGVAPGDRLVVSILIDNNGDQTGNSGGEGRPSPTTQGCSSAFQPGNAPAT